MRRLNQNGSVVITAYTPWEDSCSCSFFGLYAVGSVFLMLYLIIVSKSTDPYKFLDKTNIPAARPSSSYCVTRGASLSVAVFSLLR
jgi:hypothetical protein